MYYREDKNGQILEEGITEAGAMSSWIAAGTAYATHGVNMMPFYIFYSMFGFQRVGDLAWAAGDMQARGFLLGAHRRPHHAQRRGPAARGRPQPRAGADDPELRPLRPDLRLRARGDHAGRHAAACIDEQENVFYYITLHERELRACRRCPTGAERGHRARACTCSATRGRRAARRRACSCSAAARSCARCIAARRAARGATAASPPTSGA